MTPDYCPPCGHRLPGHYPCCEHYPDGGFWFWEVSDPDDGFWERWNAVRASERAQAQ